MKFIGSLSDHDITISAATPTDKAMLSHIRVFAVTDDEYAEFDTLTDQQIKINTHILTLTTISN